jgi:hypothetical protein
MALRTPIDTHDISLGSAAEGQVLMSAGGQAVRSDYVKQVSLSLTPGADGAVLMSAGGNDVAVAKVNARNVAEVADSNVIGGVEVVYRVPVPDGTTGNVDVVVTYKTRVIDAHLVKTVGAGGVSDTITVSNGADAITNAMDINVADKAIVRAGTIDDATHEIAAAGTLRVVRTKASAANVACVVYVRGIIVA